MDLGKNEFDEKAKTWDAQPDRAHRAQVIAEAINDEIPHDSALTAMEYGCGTGLLSFPLKDRFSKITMIDNSDGMITVLKDKIAREQVANMDVLKIDLLDPATKITASFNVIYSAMVLHHIEDIDTILSVWYSMLTAPGYLCIADLDSDNGLFHGAGFKGHNGFDRSELEKRIVNTGFVDVKFRSVYEIRKTIPDGTERSFPLFLMAAAKVNRI